MEQQRVEVCAIHLIFVDADFPSDYFVCVFVCELANRLANWIIESPSCDTWKISYLLVMSSSNGFVHTTLRCTNRCQFYYHTFAHCMNQQNPLCHPLHRPMSHPLLNQSSDASIRSHRRTSRIRLIHQQPLLRQFLQLLCLSQHNLPISACRSEHQRSPRPRLKPLFHCLKLAHMRSIRSFQPSHSSLHRC